MYMHMYIYIHTYIHIYTYFCKYIHAYVGKFGKLPLCAFDFCLHTNGVGTIRNQCLCYFVLQRVLQNVFQCVMQCVAMCVVLIKMEWELFRTQQKKGQAGRVTRFNEINENVAPTDVWYRGAEMMHVYAYIHVCICIRTCVYVRMCICIRI